MNGALGAAGALPLRHCELPPALCHNLTPRSYGCPDHECPNGTPERLSMTPKGLQRGDHYSKTTDTSVGETHSSNQTARYCSQADQSAFQNITVFPRDHEPQQPAGKPTHHGGGVQWSLAGWQAQESKRDKGAGSRKVWECEAALADGGRSAPWDSSVEPAAPFPNSEPGTQAHAPALGEPFKGLPARTAPSAHGLPVGLWVCTQPWPGPQKPPATFSVGPGPSFPSIWLHAGPCLYPDDPAPHGPVRGEFSNLAAARTGKLWVGSWQHSLTGLEKGCAGLKLAASVGRHSSSEQPLSSAADQIPHGPLNGLLSDLRAVPEHHGMGGGAVQSPSLCRGCRVYTSCVPTPHRKGSPGYTPHPPRSLRGTQ